MARAVLATLGLPCAPPCGATPAGPGSGPVPGAEAMWAEVVEVAQVEGVEATARALRLDRARLAARMTAARAAAGGEPAAEVGGGFVEFDVRRLGLSQELSQLLADRADLLYRLADRVERGAAAPTVLLRFGATRRASSGGGSWWARGLRCFAIVTPRPVDG